MRSRLYGQPEKSRYTDLTLTQARTMRDHHARLAAEYADRVDEARAAADFASMAHWLREYERSTVRCRVLGEVIRSRQAGGPEGAPVQPLEPPAGTVVRLSPPRPHRGPPTSGAAA